MGTLQTHPHAQPTLGCAEYHVPLSSLARALFLARACPGALPRRLGVPGAPLAHSGPALLGVPRPSIGMPGTWCAVGRLEAQPPLAAPFGAPDPRFPLARPRLDQCGRALRERPLGLRAGLLTVASLATPGSLCSRPGDPQAGGGAPFGQRRHTRHTAAHGGPQAAGATPQRRAAGPQVGSGGTRACSCTCFRIAASTQC